MTYKTLASSILCLSAVSLSAQIVPADTISLKEVEVVKPIKANVDLLPLTTTTITERTISESAESSLLPVLANQVPGLFVTERGIGGYGISGGAAGVVNIRGVGGNNKVLFLIDGQPQWSPIFGHALPDTYVTGNVERVEVVRGPSSLLYGSNAMGGSVNIITKSPKTDGFSGNARAMAGSYASQKYGANLSYKHDRLKLFVSAMYESSDGHRKGMDYWLANQFASADYTLSNHWTVGSNVTLTEGKPHNPGSIYSPLESMWTQIMRGTASVFAHNHYRNADGGIQGFYNWGNHDVDDGHAPGAAPRDYIFHSKDYNMGVNVFQNVRPWRYTTLSLGLDYKHWGGRTWNEQRDGSGDKPGVDKSIDEVAGYAMVQQGLFDEHLSLNAGLRLEHSSQFGDVAVPQAGFIITPSTANSLKFSWGKGFRSPNMRELYMYAAANPDLKPEYLWNYELEYRQHLMDGRLNFGVSLYYIDGKNMIQTATIDGRPHNVNTGAFKNKGFEIDASWRITRTLAFNGNYSYLHTDTPILAAPHDKLFGELVYTPGRWQISVESMNVWGLYTQTGKDPVKVSYSLLNARVAYTLGMVKLFCKGENLTATKYEINYGFPMPKATVMCGVEIKF